MDCALTACVVAAVVEELLLSVTELLPPAVVAGAPVMKRDPVELAVARVLVVTSQLMVDVAVVTQFAKV